ncbi:MAG: type II secretion system F family protein, partial [Caulobacteraceae bacterium]
MQIEVLETALTAISVLLIPAGFGGVGYVLLRDASARARRRTRFSSDAGANDTGRGSAGAALSGVADGVKRIGDRIAIKDPSQISALRSRLIRAGFFNREAVTFYLGARVIALCAATGGTLLLLPWALGGGGGMGVIAVAAVFAIAALLGPERVISQRIAKREREYREGFPDLLDLLVASVEAGLSLDAAVGRITGELTRRYPHLAEHLHLLTLELRAGRSRKEVWARLADRLGIDEARSFATMLRQAEEMGTSLGDTLKVFADEMRMKRMMRAEEKALALPAKLVVPLILFIFPCLLGVLILPAAFRVAQLMSHHQ